MAAFAYQLARLIGPFHGISPLRDVPAALRLASGPKPPRLARLIGEGSPPVNVTSQLFAGILYTVGVAAHPNKGDGPGQNATAIRQRLSAPKTIDVM